MEKTASITSIITHPNFKSAATIIPYVNGASDINLFIGDALKYQYMFEKKIPFNEKNNWQREKEGERLNSFKLKICEIDRLFMIQRDTPATEGLYNHYHFMGRINNNEKLLYVYLDGTLDYYANSIKVDANGYIFLSENVHVFLTYINMNQCFKDSIYNFLLKTDNIVRFTKNGSDYYSSFLEKRRFTLLNLCLEKIKNDRKYYKTSELPQNLQNFLDYKNLKDAITEKRTISSCPYPYFAYFANFDYDYFDYLDDCITRLYSTFYHYSEFCLICLDQKTQNNLINNDCYLLEYSSHVQNKDCNCSLCQKYDWLEFCIDDDDDDDDDEYEDVYEDEEVSYEMSIIIHQPNMERLCVDLLETNYCENILNCQHLLQKRVPLSERTYWGEGNDLLNSFQIHLNDIDQLYYIRNDKNLYYSRYFNNSCRGYFIRVMGRIFINGKFLYFELVMWTLFAASAAADDNDKCNYHRGGFLFLSEDVSAFIYCVIEQYSKNHRKDILRKIFDDKGIITNKHFRYDKFKVEEMKKSYYYKDYNYVKDYLNDPGGKIDPFFIYLLS